MFDIQWAGVETWKQQPLTLSGAASALDRTRVDRTLYLVWSEHCVECAAPDCYQTCSLYVPRADRNCTRFLYGIYPNTAFAGHFDFGADIHFRRWGKLEAALDVTSLPIPVLPHKSQERFSRLRPRLRQSAARIAARAIRPRLDFDEFVLECHSPSPEPFKLILAYTVFEGGIGTTMLRHAFDIRPGSNFFSIPCRNFELRPAGYLRLYPEDSAAEKRLIFTWLDFVRYKSGSRIDAASPGPQPAPKPAPRAQPAPKPAPKLKCVAWDLDNTLWNGTLVETDGNSGLELGPGVAELIRALDERGIIQTIVSRNNHADAWAQIERLGLAGYFVYPAINQGQKSENLRKVAEHINIGLDTFALVDDSPLQRSEVQTALPQVRVYTQTQIASLLDLPEFHVPVTEASRVRRLSYLASMRREEIQAAFHGSYEDFLVECRMELRLFTPREPEGILRCWELVQRSNQLNLSGRRYSLDDFRTLLAGGSLRGFGIAYKDRFGDYGTVGFAALDLRDGQPLLSDMVLSCRVAQQRVEHMFIKWLAGRLRAEGASEIRAGFVRTERNGPLRQVFSDLAFEVVKETETESELRRDLRREFAIRDVAEIVAAPELSLERPLA